MNDLGQRSKAIFKKFNVIALSHVEAQGSKFDLVVNKVTVNPGSSFK